MGCEFLVVDHPRLVILCSVSVWLSACLTHVHVSPRNLSLSAWLSVYCCVHVSGCVVKVFLLTLLFILLLITIDVLLAPNLLNSSIDNHGFVAAAAAGVVTLWLVLLLSLSLRAITGFLLKLFLYWCCCCCRHCWSWWCCIAAQIHQTGHTKFQDAMHQSAGL